MFRCHKLFELPRHLSIKQNSIANPPTYQVKAQKYHQRVYDLTKQSMNSMSTYG